MNGNGAALVEVVVEVACDPPPLRVPSSSLEEEGAPPAPPDGIMKGNGGALIPRPLPLRSSSLLYRAHTHTTTTAPLALSLSLSLSLSPSSWPQGERGSRLRLQRHQIDTRVRVCGTTVYMLFLLSKKTIPYLFVGDGEPGAKYACVSSDCY